MRLKNKKNIKSSFYGVHPLRVVFHSFKACMQHFSMTKNEIFSYHKRHVPSIHTANSLATNRNISHPSSIKLFLTFASKKSGKNNSRFHAYPIPCLEKCKQFFSLPSRWLRQKLFPSPSSSFLFSFNGPMVAMENQQNLILGALWEALRGDFLSVSPPFPPPLPTCGWAPKKE